MTTAIDWPDYARLEWEYQRHHERFVKRVQDSKLLCQDCGGSGEVLEEHIYGYDERRSCGWCEGTGKLTPWLRGQWLKYQREAKR